MIKKKDKDKRGRPKKSFVSYSEAAEWAKNHNINSTSWRRLAEEKKLPVGFPVSPEKSYKEFVSWAKFLGKADIKFEGKDGRQIGISVKNRNRNSVLGYINSDWKEFSYSDDNFYFDKIEKYSLEMKKLQHADNTIDLFVSHFKESISFKKKFGERLYWFFYIILADLVASTEIKFSKKNNKVYRIEHIRSHPRLGLLKSISKTLILNNGDNKNFYSIEDLRDGLAFYQKDRVKNINDDDIQIENNLLFLSNLYFLLANSKNEIPILMSASESLYQLDNDLLKIDNKKLDNEKKASIKNSRKIQFQKVMNENRFFGGNYVQTLTDEVLNLIEKFSINFSERLININSKNKNTWINPEARSLQHFRNIFGMSRRKLNFFIGDDRESATKIIKFEQNATRCLFENDPFNLSKGWNKSFKPKYDKGDTLQDIYLKSGSFQHKILAAMFDIVKEKKTLQGKVSEKENLINFRHFLSKNHLFIPLIKATRIHIDENFTVTTDTEDYVHYFSDFEEKLYKIAEKDKVGKLPILVELIYYLMNTNYFKDQKQGSVENFIGNLQFRYQDEDLVVDYKNKEDEISQDQYILDKPYEFWRNTERSHTLKVIPQSNYDDNVRKIATNDRELVSLLDEKKGSDLGSISISLLPPTFEFHKSKSYSTSMIDDSMEPEINKFDKLLYIEQKDRTIEYGSLYLFKGGDVRRLVKPGSLEDGRVLIQAVNESKWPSNEVNIEDLNIIGKIVAVIKAY